jgi:hypothetical protein
VDQAAALEFLAKYLGVDEDDFEYEWRGGAGHTFYQHSTDKRHTVQDPTSRDGNPVVITTD